MKSGRNSLCPCGSGLKYKKCCLGKTQEQLFADALIYSNRSLAKESRIKQCLHPNQNECNQRIIRSHAIQNNRILSRISDNGDVITMDGISNLFFQDAQVKGRRIATVFTGFCGYHDKILFQEIEDRDFVGSQKQVFLITYRTMAWHCHKKQEQLNSFTIQNKRMKERGQDIGSTSENILTRFGLNLAISDNRKEKKIFDNALLNQAYEEVNWCIWEIPYEVQFTVSMMYELEHDINGQTINNLDTDKNLKKLYLNIIPSKSVSYCIWSWLKQNDGHFVEFSKQFMELGEVNQINYLNNNLPRWTDSIIISPKLWRKWGDEVQNALIAHANYEIFYRALEEEELGYKFIFHETPWDFFEML